MSISSSVSLPQAHAQVKVTYNKVIPNYELTLPFDATIEFKFGESIQLNSKLASVLANYSDNFKFEEEQEQSSTVDNKQKVSDGPDKIHRVGSKLNR
ncbi:unnamed protein product [Didymodactylos carnosus]|uniref:Uncharacterized protein n=1 Tax=Didymodactylos carnosus TaxID=1234261 RepID=A0A8S2U5G6_9BILA|nr:unnamed protein product [Didymodactylos carnosus]CAF4324631.1 unnamed protein product [Didymodactylos carnosus]